MTKIIIEKEELIDFIKSVGKRFEEQRSFQGQRTIEVSGYQDGGEVFLIDYEEHPSTKGGAR